MNFLNRLRRIVQPLGPPIPHDQPVVQPVGQAEKKSEQSFELIMIDVISSGEDEKLQALNKKKSSNKSEVYQQLIYEEDVHGAQEYICLKDYVFINKLPEARELTVEQWNQMIDSGQVSMFPKQHLYFSIFKGIKFEVRKKTWQLLANVPQMKKLAVRPYSQLTNPNCIRADIVVQIDKDVPRTKNITQYLPELRNILIAYCTFTGKDYTQGMNLIAGSLLTLLALDNDEELSGFNIFEKEFEERVFWIFIGVMVHKGWDDIFDKNLSGLTKRLHILEKMMVEHVPKVYQAVIDHEWDLTIFAQYYITIMLYNTPKQFSKIILDLFFLDGEWALHQLIIRMMKIQEDKILSMSDESLLINYFKKEIIVDCYNSVKKNQPNARKLEDFQISFKQMNNA